MNILYDPIFIARAAFFNGFFSHTKLGNFSKFPLSTIGSSILGAALSSKVNSVVIDLLPEYARPAWSVFLITSTVFYIVKGGSDKPLFKLSIKSNDNKLDFQVGGA